MWRNLLALARYRGLIQSLVTRELKARYRGSVLGFFWSFVNPLLLLLIYSVVFTYFLENRAEGLQPYALFLFCGLLPWTWFSTSLNESASVLISGGNLIKKVLFPAEVLPIVSVLANMVHFLFGLPILAAFLVYYMFIHVPPPVDPAGAAPAMARISLHAAELIWFPVVVLIQLILTLGLSLLISALAVHYRDIKDILSNLLTFWFFATPIIYPWFFLVPDGAPGAAVPAEPGSPWMKWFIDLNPFSHIAISYQEVLFFPGNQFGHLPWLLVMAAVSPVVFLGGYWVFDRLRDSFAEAV
jgi:ABC-type polysaccharide/polyol phosphate export permease